MDANGREGGNGSESRLQPENRTCRALRPWHYPEFLRNS